MNKNIKRIIAITLALGVFSVVGSARYTNNPLFATEAHASSSDADELTSLELETSDGDSLSLYEDSSYDNELSDDLSVGGTYYAKTSSSEVVINSIDGADEDNVRIFKSGSSKAYEVGNDISISEATTTILKVRVYEDSYDADEDYSSSDYNQYTIVVKNTTSTDDDVDLLGLRLNNGYVNFNPSTTSYDVTVPSDATSTMIQAMPKDEDYTVTIDGTTVSKDNNYITTVSLDTDSTTDTIEVVVSNDDDSKTYTLNITKSSTTGVLQQGMTTTGMTNQQGYGYANGDQWYNNGSMNNNGNMNNNNWNSNNNNNNNWNMNNNNGMGKRQWKW